MTFTVDRVETLLPYSFTLCRRCSKQAICHASRLIGLGRDAHHDSSARYASVWSLAGVIQCEARFSTGSLRGRFEMRQNLKHGSSHEFGILLLSHCGMYPLATSVHSHRWNHGVSSRYRLRRRTKTITLKRNNGVSITLDTQTTTGSPFPEGQSSSQLRRIAVFKRNTASSGFGPWQ